jgi:NADPH:quinone reductase-like Zn-dependent oxidoreductase
VGTIAIQLARHLGAHIATTTGAANAGWVRNLGAAVVIDCKREDFDELLCDYDVVLDSLGGQTLEKSLRVLKPGGIAIGIAGPPHPGFAREIGASLVVRLATVLLSARTRLRARRRRVRYSFLFMKASGEQLRAIAALVDAGAISRSSTGASPSRRSRAPWPTSRAAGPRARSSSRWLTCRWLTRSCRLPPRRPQHSPRFHPQKGHGHD